MPVLSAVFFFPAGEQDSEEAEDDFINHRDYVRYHEIEQEEGEDQQEQLFEPQAVGEGHEYCDEGVGLHYLSTMIQIWSSNKEFSGYFNPYILYVDYLTFLF